MSEEFDYSFKIGHCTSLEELFSIWKEKASKGRLNHRNNFIPDGVVNPEIWNSEENKKILFVLKEAYGDDWGDNTLATWLHTYPHRRMWDRVARVVYGINNTTRSSIARYRSELTSDEHSKALDQIAVINLKKSDGKSQSEYEDIAEYARYDREEIKKEIELINPEIIICGSTFSALYEDVYEQKHMYFEEKSDNWYYHWKLNGKKRLFIDYYHPAIHDADLMYYYGLLGIYQQSLLRENFIGN